MTYTNRTASYAAHLRASTCITKVGAAAMLALLVGAAAAGQAAAQAPAPVPPGPATPAQPGATDTQVDTITVTASEALFSQKAEQHVGDAETFVNAATLKDRDIRTLRDVQSVAPNVSIRSMAGTATTSFYIRGVGMNDFTQNNTASVMPYIDNVPYPMSSMMNGLFFNIQGISLTPGPVGFDHGQTDTGGEIVLLTADPTSSMHAGIVEDLASYWRSRTTGYVSGPINDQLQFRVDAETVHGGAYQTDQLNGRTLGNANETASRFKLKWTPDDLTSIRLNAHLTRDQSEIVNGFVTSNNLASQVIPVNTDYWQTQWSLRPQMAQVIGRPASLKPSENNWTWGASVDITREIGAVTAESITALNTLNEAEYVDADGSAYATNDTYRKINANVLSQEVKLHGTDLSAPFQWVAGVYFSRTDQVQNVFTDEGQFPLVATIVETAYGEAQKNVNGYVTASYKLPQNVKLIGGLSYEWDSRQLLNLTGTTFGKSAINFGSSSTSSNAVTGKASVEWQAMEDFLAYATFSKGYKPGGFFANFPVSSVQLAPFAPETLNSYQVGFKSDPIPGRLRVNADAFYYQYHNQQISSAIVFPSFGALSDFVNVPQSHMWGVETEIQAHPFEHIFINQNIGYERGEYDNLAAVNTTAVNQNFQKTGQYVSIFTDFSHTDLGLPRLTLDGNVVGRFNPVAGYITEAQVNYSYRDAMGLAPGNAPVRTLPAYALFGASLTVKPEAGPWTATIYVSNMLNRRYQLTQGYSSASNFSIAGPPRFIGGKIGWEF